jgi:hypothetical protein
LLTLDVADLKDITHTGYHGYFGITLATILKIAA